MTLPLGDNGRPGGGGIALPLGDNGRSAGAPSGRSVAGRRASVGVAGCSGGRPSAAGRPLEITREDASATSAGAGVGVSATAGVGAGSTGAGATAAGSAGAGGRDDGLGRRHRFGGSDNRRRRRLGGRCLDSRRTGVDRCFLDRRCRSLGLRSGLGRCVDGHLRSGSRCCRRGVRRLGIRRPRRLPASHLPASLRPSSPASASRRHHRPTASWRRPSSPAPSWPAWPLRVVRHGSTHRAQRDGSPCRHMPRRARTTGPWRQRRAHRRDRGPRRSSSRALSRARGS